MQHLVVHIAILGLGRQAQRSEIADGSLFAVALLNDLGAEVGRTDCAQVLLVALGVAVIFEKDLWGASLYLALKNHIPQFLSFHLFLDLSLFFLRQIFRFEVSTPRVYQTRTLVWTHERPVRVFLDSAHE